MREDITSVINNYFYQIRTFFGQDINLTIYRANIISEVMKLPQVLNVKDVYINNLDNDLEIIDEGDIGKQYLPYLKEVIIE